MSNTKHLLLGYVLSGVLLGFGFLYADLWLLGLFAVAVYVYCLSKTEYLWLSVGGSFLTWFIKSLCAISWFWHTYPIPSFETTADWLQLFSIGFYWVSASVCLGTGGAIAGFVFYKIKPHVTAKMLMFIFPLLWAVSEIGGSLMFAIGSYGDGGSLNVVFSFGYLGYLVGNHELLLMFAKLGGVYVLSIIGAFVGYLLFVGWNHLPKNKAGMILVCVAGGLLISDSTVFTTPYVPPEASSAVRVAVIDTRFGGEEFYSRVDKYEYKSQVVFQAITDALALNPTHILLPEDSRFFNLTIPPETVYRTFRFVKSDPEVVIVDSGRLGLPNNTAVLRASIYDGINKNIYTADKQYLVPHGEYLPYYTTLSLRLLGMNEVAGKLFERFSYRPGPYKSQALFPSDIPGVLFCFESVDPRGVRRLLNDRAVPFIAHPVSHAWFHESKMLWDQLDVMLKIQAVWNGVPIVSAGNMVTGALYTSDGQKVQPEKVVEGESYTISIINL